VRNFRWIAAFGVLAGAACGSSSGINNPIEPPPGVAVPADTVNIIDNSFGPSTVKITAGGSVTWTWDATNTMQHNVRWGSWPGAVTSPPNGPTQATGAPFEVILTAVGMYEFVCSLHSGMSGAVFVE
jgi:plastocyanin